MTSPSSPPLLGFDLVEPGRPPRPADKYDLPLVLGTQRQFHLLAKPSGSLCNLDCNYCFYLSKPALPGGPGVGGMSDATLEQLIREYIAGVSGPEVVFSWQGGEPTLMGLDFFRKVVALEKKHAKPGQRIQNDLQTNGTLIDEEWCRFLKENHFLVGLSIDGPRDIHDRFRLTKGRQPTFDKVLGAAKLLKQFAIPFNTLTCIHRFNAQRPLDVYRFLRRELGASYLQFIPIVEPKNFELTPPPQRDQWAKRALAQENSPESRPGHPNSIVTDWSVDPEQWGEFLWKTFQEWRSRDLGKVYVSHFETLVAQQLGLPSQICVYSECCGKCLAIEHDGSLYACDHYVYPEFRLGNIHDGQLASKVFSRAQVQFGYSKSEALPKRCLQCPFLGHCWGECPKNRFLRTAEGEPGMNYLCLGLKRFFERAIPEVERIVADLRKQKLHLRRRM